LKFKNWVLFSGVGAGGFCDLDPDFEETEGFFLLVWHCIRRGEVELWVLKIRREVVLAFERA